jgi:CHRD domain
MAIMTSRRAIFATLLVFAVASATETGATPASFSVKLTGADQVPPVQSPGVGTADLTYDPTNRKVIWSITCSGLSGPVTMAHFHGPAPAGKNAAITLWLTRQGIPNIGAIRGGATLTPEQAEQFAAGLWYINVHTKEHPDGEIRGQVVPPKE